MVCVCVCVKKKKNNAAKFFGAYLLTFSTNFSTQIIIMPLFTIFINCFLLLKNAAKIIDVFVKTKKSKKKGAFQIVAYLIL
jgi:hypothetical protein